MRPCQSFHYFRNLHARDSLLPTLRLEFEGGPYSLSAHVDRCLDVHAVIREGGKVIDRCRVGSESAMRAFILRCCGCRPEVVDDTREVEEADLEGGAGCCG